MNFTIDPAFLTGEDSSHAVVRGLIGPPIHIKLAGLNAVGSIKLWPALRMITELEAAGRIRPDTQLIESSSGNLGIALSAVCANRGYSFTCVTDPNSSAQARKAMNAMGARVIVVDQRDQQGGFLNTRLDLIRRLCAEDPRYIWVNQYANRSNWLAHHDITAREVHAAFPRVDWLLIGAGTTGTVVGCGHFFRQCAPRTRIIAVDAVGSVIFGGAPGKRYIPGIGATRAPEILDSSCFDEVVYVDELSAIRMCRSLAKRGLLVGGSTGSVLAAAVRLRRRIREDEVVVAISPDMGDKYLDSIYDEEWVGDRFRSAESGA